MCFPILRQLRYLCSLINCHYLRPGARLPHTTSIPRVHRIYCKVLGVYIVRYSLVYLPVCISTSLMARDLHGLIYILKILDTFLEEDEM